MRKKTLDVVCRPPANIGRMKQRPKWGAAAACSGGLSRGKENVAANTAAAKAKPKARCVAVA